MYVCVCKAVTERQLAAAVEDGAGTLRQLRDQLGITSECGRCACYARDCLHAALAGRDPAELTLEAA